MPCATQRRSLALAELERLEIVLDAERVEHLDRHDLVPSARHVHAVGVPEPAVAIGAHPPEVDERRAVGVGDLADQLVVDRETTAQRCEHRDPARVVRGEHHEMSAGIGESAEGLVVRLDQHVEVDARSKHVVGAGVDADQVRLHRQRGLDLLIEDRQQLAAADREIGVGEVVIVGRQHLGHAVGPATDSVGQRLVVIANTFGEGVAQGDIAVKLHPIILPAGLPN